MFVNITACVSAACNCLGLEHCLFYYNNIATLTDIISNRIDTERKNAAVLLATLSKNEKCKERMRETHALEVLISLSK